MINRQGARSAKEKQIKNQLQPQRRKGAKKSRKELLIWFSFASRRAFAPLRLLLFSAFPLRLCAFAVIAFPRG
jgi:hypothetical protein